MLATVTFARQEKLVRENGVRFERHYLVLTQFDGQPVSRKYTCYDGLPDGIKAQYGHIIQDENFMSLETSLGEAYITIRHTSTCAVTV